MEAEFKKPSFIIDLDAKDDNFKPLNTVYKKPVRKNNRVTMPNVYHKYECEFFDIIKSCAQYIDKLDTVDKKCEMNKKLTRIFISRHTGAAMQFFRDLFRMLQEQ